MAVVALKPVDRVEILSVMDQLHRRVDGQHADRPPRQAGARRSK